MYVSEQSQLATVYGIRKRDIQRDEISMKKNCTIKHVYEIYIYLKNYINNLYNILSANF